ncbi:MAG: putative lipid II flippase FtsW [Roseburia sp.]|uniref:FtsW/RodA/SpoVE family cell cycle protein n=1 Tax=Roseburia sp. 831b TaxID=1261635 RepID=UPI0009531640|nr:putative peptidoglycan glycosyltransferase FtsW [Roseburia sp. 831b]MCI5919680.1 putative lipid II flippase FtsW [Roseburia sp.]MDD6217172.1 putative peptidoglycan glycosyltransferase FtsW [Roseburia sp.]MDY5883348.1 putative peptidoglycan glycosyltransferase FtsW [Roseburia sp.]WVK71673.1 putative peptidoglycan glycosyltransferase FtsW [Roseburia sp. 831b]
MAQKEGKKKEKTVRYFDYSLLFIVIFLLGFGLVMLYSTSSYSGATKYNDAAHYLKRQMASTALGLVVMAFLSKVDYHFWRKLGGLAYIGALGLCTAVIFVGHESKGQARWLYIGGVSFQPSEFAKLAVILFLAMIIYKIPKQMGRFRSLVIVMALIIPIVGVVAYNNLSTAIIIMGIAVCMLFVASPKYSHFVWMVLVVGVVGVIFVLLESYRAERIQIWLDPTSSDKGYQTLQGLYAIGSGGLFGKGLGESMQKLGFIPEAQNDMIFSIICEELGLFGAICVIALFLLLIWRFMIIANNAADLYGALIVVGIMAHISIQVVLNIAVVTNTIPNTGISLPFISYGGTSIMFLLAEIGLALSVSRGIKFDAI